MQENTTSLKNITKIDKENIEKESSTKNTVNYSHKVVSLF